MESVNIRRDSKWFEQDGARTLSRLCSSNRCGQGSPAMRGLGKLGVDRSASVKAPDPVLIVTHFVAFETMNISGEGVIRSVH